LSIRSSAATAPFGADSALQMVRPKRFELLTPRFVD
jgi:hypothetical protein